MPHQLLQLIEVAGVLLEVADGEGGAERVGVNLDSCAAWRRASRSHR
jgi:hypothetical protein